MVTDGVIGLLVTFFANVEKPWGEEFLLGVSVGLEEDRQTAPDSTVLLSASAG